LDDFCFISGELCMTENIRVVNWERQGRVRLGEKLGNTPSKTHDVLLRRRPETWEHNVLRVLPWGDHRSHGSTPSLCRYIGVHMERFWESPPWLTQYISYTLHLVTFATLSVTCPYSIRSPHSPPPPRLWLGKA
jgi:hypothetical protein